MLFLLEETLKDKQKFGQSFLGNSETETEINISIGNDKKTKSKSTKADITRA